MFKKFKSWVISLFHRTDKTDKSTSDSNGSPRKEECPEVLSGSWRLPLLLDALPFYHRILRKCDRKYRGSGLKPVLRMGPTIIAGDDSWLLTTDKHSKWKVLPAQFFVSWASPTIHRESAEKDQVQPAFFAGIKVDPPLTVQRLPGECYEFLLYWSEFGGFWVGGYLYVDGKTVRLAKERRRITKKITRNGHWPLRVPSIVYDSPLEEIFNEAEDGKMSSEDVVNMFFRSAMNWWAERDKRWLVVTKQNNRRISFSVEEHRHLYFFRDRDKVVTTPTGKRKTIFHICSEHLRKVSPKKTITIKEHCRGLRHFFWLNCECHIFAPGWHGADFFASFDGKLHNDDEVENPEDWVDAGGASEKMARVLEGTSVR